MGIRRFEDLIAWQKAYDLCLTVYRLTGKFPKDEQYGLTAHLRKTAISCPSNIAEGYERKNNKEFNTFIRIALGSLAELKTQLLLAKDMKYLSENNYSDCLVRIEEVQRVSCGLRQSLQVS
jgi:four helix bundle protein